MKGNASILVCMRIALTQGRTRWIPRSISPPLVMCLGRIARTAIRDHLVALEKNLAPSSFNELRAIFHKTLPVVENPENTGNLPNKPRGMTFPFIHMDVPMLRYHLPYK